MKSITVRGIDHDLDRALKEVAASSSTSLNATILRLLRQSVGLEKKKFRAVHHDLDALAGTWSEDEVREFEEHTRPFAEVDEEMWK